MMKLMETEQDGTQICFQRIYTPVMTSDRSIIQAFYPIERKEDGTLIFISGSTGNDPYVNKYAKEIGSDVVATCFIAYAEVIPIRDESGKVVGSRVIWILNIDVAGQLPDFIKKEIGKAQCAGLDNIVEYCKKNYKA